MIYFTAHTFKCVCHCRRAMFRVLGMYNFAHTANVYRDLRVLYREIWVRGFQIYGDCMLPTIPAKISCKVKKKERKFSVLFKSFFKFPNNFCGDFRLPVIPLKFIWYPVQCRDFLYFL